VADDGGADWAGYYAASAGREPRPLLLAACQELGAGQDRLAIDLGCGEGRTGRVLQSRGYQVAGVDAAPTMVRLATSHEVPEPAVLADAAALPFRDGAFGLVVAYMSLHDMDRMPEAVAEAARVLDHGGRLVLAIPHPVNSAGSFQARGADAPFTIAGSYVDPGPADWVMDRSGVRLTFHSEHRPLESYSRALEGAGLLIEAIREPRAPDGRWQRIPLSLQLRAVKP